MSVKHLEYLRISSSKVLVVEVRPVKCLVDTPSGPTHTDKWMECSHWKELYHLMTGIVDEYEEQDVTQGIRNNEPKCKTGTTIQIGYMFRGLPSCWCSLYFLTPRNPFSWTSDDDGNGELQDKGGSYEDFALCGQMLVISVTLRDSSASNTMDTTPTPSWSGTSQQARLNHKLVKALDSRNSYVSSISDYFMAPTESTDGISAQCVPSTSRRRQRSPPLRVKTLTICKAEEDEGGECNDFDSSVSPSISFSLKEINSEAQEREKNLLCAYNSEYAMFNETKIYPNCVEDIESKFTGMAYKTNNLENNTERPMDPAYQCNDINSPKVFHGFGSVTSGSEDMFSSLESTSYELDTLNDRSISYSASANPVNDDVKLGNISLRLQSDSFTATDPSDEADKDSRRHSVMNDSTLFGVVQEENVRMSKDFCESREAEAWNCQRLPRSIGEMKEHSVRSREVDKAYESSINGNESEMKMKNQKDLLPHKVQSYCLPQTDTNRGNSYKNSPYPDTECESTSEDYDIDVEGSINCTQMSQASFAFAESSGYGPGRKSFQVEATKRSGLFTTSVKNFHAGNELEKDLESQSDSAERQSSHTVPSSQNETQECLVPRGLVTPMTDIPMSVHETRDNGDTDKRLFSTPDYGNFSFVGSDTLFLEPTPKHEYQGATQLSSKNKVNRVQSSKKTPRHTNSVAGSEQLTLNRKLCENFDSPETKCKDQTQNVRKKRKVNRKLIQTSEDSDPEDMGKCMLCDCDIHQCHCNLHRSRDPRSSCQNLHDAIMDSTGEMDKQSSGQIGLENVNIRCPKDQETSESFEYVEKPETKLDALGHAPYRSDEEYVPSQVTCKYKKKRKKTTPDLELEYYPTKLRNLTATNYGSCRDEDPVEKEGDFPHNIGTSEAESVGYTDKCEVKLGFKNSSPCRADEEYVPEIITCNRKEEYSKNVLKNLEQENVPTKVMLLSSTNQGSCAGENLRVQEGDLTQVSVGLPLCVEEGDCIPKRKQQQMEATESCAPLSSCRDGNDENYCEDDLDLPSLSAEKCNSQKMPDTTETPYKCGPPQKLVSHVNKEIFYYPQGFQDCARSSESGKERFKISSVCDDQEAGQERMKNNDYLRSFRISENSQGKYGDGTYMKRKEFKGKKPCYDTERIKKRNACSYQKDELEKGEVISSTPASITARKKKLCFNENAVGESALKGNSSDSIPSQRANISYDSSKEQVDALKGSVQSENLDHIQGNSSLQSPSCPLLQEEKGDPGVREDGKESENISSCNSQNHVEQKTALEDNRKAQPSEGSNSLRMHLAKDYATDKKCKPKKVMHSKRKTTPEKKSYGKCVTKGEGSEKSGQDTRMEHSFDESSNNCTPVKMCKDITLSEENKSELLQSKKEIKELAPRRSSRLKEKTSRMFWLFDAGDDDSSDEHFKEKSNIAAETAKSIKFFEKYVQERNANKSNLKQQKILSYVKSDKTRNQENDCDEWLFKSVDKLSPVTKQKSELKHRSESMTSKMSKKLDSVSPRSMKSNASKKLDSVKQKSMQSNVSKKLNSKANTSPQKLKSPTKRGNTSEGSHKKMSIFNFDNEETEETVKSNNKCTKKEKKPVTQERKKVSPKKNARKRVQKKKTLFDGTSAVHDSQKNIEDSSTAAEKDAHRWLMLDEMVEEVENLIVIEDTVLQSNQASPISPRTEQSNKALHNEQPQSTQRDDEVGVLFFQSLESLKASYRRLLNMTESDLEQRMDENLSYLEHVVLGRVPNERHEMFVSSLQKLKRQQDYLICGPFTADQTEHVLELLKKKLSHLDSMFESVYDVLTYRCRVLMPTFLTKVVMDNEKLSLQQAEQLMIKFSLDTNITGTTNTKDWRKF